MFMGSNSGLALLVLQPPLELGRKGQLAVFVVQTPFVMGDSILPSVDQSNAPCIHEDQIGDITNRPLS